MLECMEILAVASAAGCPGGKGHRSAVRTTERFGKGEFDQFRLETEAPVAGGFIAERFGIASASLSNWLGWRGTKKPEARSPMADSVLMLGWGRCRKCPIFRTLQKHCLTDLFLSNKIGT